VEQSRRTAEELVLSLQLSAQPACGRRGIAPATSLVTAWRADAKAGCTVARELEDVEVINRQKLALAALFAGVRAAAPKPAPGPLLQLSESGAITTNRGKTLREQSTPKQ